MLLLLLLPLLASASASPWTPVGAPSRSKRSMDDVFGGYNITAAALIIRDNISSPTCNATEACGQFTTTVVPRCLGLMGSAGCWCGLEDATHYCAICMMSPTDNRTTPDQTQSATQGHLQFHEGCAAYASSLGITQTMSMSMNMPMPTASNAVSTPLSTGSASTNAAGPANKHSNTGPIVGGVVGGILGLLLVGIGAWLGRKYLQTRNNGQPEPFQGGNNTDTNPRPFFAGGMADSKATSYYSNSQPPPMSDYSNNRMSYAQPYPYSPTVTSQNPNIGQYSSSTSKDYDTSMLSHLSPHSNSANYAGSPLGNQTTGQTWSSNPVTPPPPFVPSANSPPLSAGAKSSETGGNTKPLGYTGGAPEAMTVE